jgi:hypothetical protein
MSDSSQGPGWWLASDGKWYPPELHPSRRPRTPEPAEAEPTVVAGPTAGETVVAEPTAGETVVAGPAPGETMHLPSEPRPVRVRRTVWADLGILWRERRGLRVAVVVASVLIVAALLATIIAGGNAPTKVLTTVPTTVATTAVPTTTASSMTTTASTTTTTTATTVATTTIPATTAPPATTRPTTSAGVGSVAICKDGTVTVSTDPTSACASHGGVQQIVR